MFLTETFDINQARPSRSGISANDWAVLARYWYPVAVDGEVKDKPVKGRLLDVELVVHRAGRQGPGAGPRCEAAPQLSPAHLPQRSPLWPGLGMPR